MQREVKWVIKAAPMSPTQISKTTEAGLRGKNIKKSNESDLKEKKNYLNLRRKVKFKTVIVLSNFNLLN